MREWLSGRASPCQGERREFESRLPLQLDSFEKGVFFCLKLVGFLPTNYNRGEMIAENT